MNTLLVLGVISLCWGLYALSKPTRSLPKSLKFIPVWTSALGAFLIWSHLAATMPVVGYSEITVLQAKPQELVLNITIRKDRQCKFNSMDAYVVDEHGIETQAKLEFLEDPTPGSTRPTGTSNLGKTIVMSYEPGEYSSFYFVTNHSCPFDIHVQSKFGYTEMPSEFNVKK